MTSINSRIKHLINTYCNGNNSEFANRVGINEANVRSYLNGTEPKFNVIEKIAKNFDINFEWLIFGKGEVEKPNVQKELYNETITNSITGSITNQMFKKGYTNEEGEEKTKSEKNNNKQNVVINVVEDVVKPKVKTITTNIERKVPQVVTITPHQEDNIVLVPVAAQAGYLTSYDDPSFIEELPTYNLPNVRNGIFRMFQVSGLSMYPTLQNNSYVVGQFVEDWLHLSDNRVYVVVTQEHGVIVKRVLNRIAKYGNLYCKSDNRDYPNISVAPEDIKEIWECKMHLSFEFLDPATVYNKLSDLEADVMHLAEELKAIKQEKL
ncbi:LexA family transcriptional regulator [Ornithobacterium rhinotracheale]